MPSSRHGCTSRVSGSDPTVFKAHISSGQGQRRPTAKSASKLVPFIPEYAQVVVLQGQAQDLPSDSTVRLLAEFHLNTRMKSSALVQVLPKNAKLLNFAKTLAGDIDIKGVVMPDVPSTSTEKQQKWGIPWDPMQFVSQAFKLGHPCNLKSQLPTPL